MAAPHPPPGHGRDGAGRPASAQSRVGWLPRCARRRAPDLRGRVSRSGSPRARPRKGQQPCLRRLAQEPSSCHRALPSAARGSSSPVRQSPLMAEAGVSGNPGHRRQAGWRRSVYVRNSTTDPALQRDALVATGCGCVFRSCFQRQGRSARAIRRTLSGENVHFAFWTSVRKTHFRVVTPNCSPGRRHRAGARPNSECVAQTRSQADLPRQRRDR